jgi:hypothetical protein
VKEGWQPLCDFLEVPVPPRPFPHVNDRQVMEKRLRDIRLVAKWGPVLAVVGILTLIFFLTHLMR